jgi:GH35 family endo-1,4-beta-xylanase
MYSIARLILLTAFFCPGVSGRAADAEGSGDPVMPQTLRQAAGKTLIGTSTAFAGENGIIRGPHVAENRHIILEHFNCIQPAFYPAWGGFWPSMQPASVEDYSFWTDPLSAQADWAHQHGLYVLHHGLFSPNYYYPEWWRSVSYSPAELEVILKNVVETVVSVEHVDAWNMFNELFLGDGRYFQDGPGEWDNKWLGLGMEPDVSGLTGAARVNEEHPRFIRIALEHAAAFTDGKLEVREGTTFRNPRKLDALYQLVLHLRNSGAPLHAVGIQGHLDADEEVDVEAFASTVAKFREAGVEVYLTELDVGLPKGLSPEEADWERIEPLQADVYYQIVTAARKAGVSLICLWGITDASAGSWRGEERALLFDQTFRPKPAYHAVLRALNDSRGVLR